MRRLSRPAASSAPVSRQPRPAWPRPPRCPALEPKAPKRPSSTSIPAFKRLRPCDGRSLGPVLSARRGPRAPGPAARGRGGGEAGEAGPVVGSQEPVELGPGRLRQLIPGIVGPDFTLRGRPTPGADGQDTLLAWTEFLSRVPAGHVVLAQGNDWTRALMGELSAETLQRKDVRGYVTDSGCRDCGFIPKIGFPCSARSAPRAMWSARGCPTLTTNRLRSASSRWRRATG